MSKEKQQQLQNLQSQFKPQSRAEIARTAQSTIAPAATKVTVVSAAAEKRAGTRKNTSISLTEEEAQYLIQLRKVLIGEHQIYNATVNKLVQCALVSNADAVDGSENIDDSSSRSAMRGFYTTSLDAYIALSEEQRQALRDEHGGIRVKLSASLNEDVIKVTQDIQQRVALKGGNANLSRSVRAAIQHVPELLEGKRVVRYG